MVPVRFVETKPRGAEVPLGPRAVLVLEVATVAPQWRAASLSRVLKPGSDGRFYMALTQQKEVAGAGAVAPCGEPGSGRRAKRGEAGAGAETSSHVPGAACEDSGLFPGLGMTVLGGAPAQPMDLGAPRDPAIVGGGPSRHLIFPRSPGG